MTEPISRTWKASRMSEVPVEAAPVRALDKKEVEGLVTDLKMRLNKLEQAGLRRGLQTTLAETIQTLEKILSDPETERFSVEGIA